MNKRMNTDAAARFSCEVASSLFTLVKESFTQSERNVSVERSTDDFSWAARAFAT